MEIKYRKLSYNVRTGRFPKQIKKSTNNSLKMDVLVFIRIKKFCSSKDIKSKAKIVTNYCICNRCIQQRMSVHNININNDGKSIQVLKDTSKKNIE